MLAATKAWKLKPYSGSIAYLDCAALLIKTTGQKTCHSGIFLIFKLAIENN